MSVRLSVALSVGPSIGWSVRPYVPGYFLRTNKNISEGKNLSNDIIIIETMSDDEVVASDLPPRYLLKHTCVRPRHHLGTFIFP